MGAVVGKSSVVTTAVNGDVIQNLEGDTPANFDSVEMAADIAGESGGEVISTNEEETQEEEDNGEYDFDYFVIGGGSGGLASAIQAAKLGARVGLCDFVTPTPSGTSWGLGGTCVNVGCIPKKLMHQAALLGQSLEDAPHFGWRLPSSISSEDGLGHSWHKLVGKIRSHIQSLNWGYRVSLQKAGVTYFNSLAKFIDDHTVQLSDKNGEFEDGGTSLTSRYFLIATGGRPRYLDGIPGGNPGEYCITSDDIFSLPYHPGKVVIVGGSYIALETAGFLSGFGIDVTLFVRSQLLRGFDQQIAEMIGTVLERHGVQILRDTIPTAIELISPGEPGTLLVTGENLKTGEILEEPCNTVILAVGRSPSVVHLDLAKIGMECDPESQKILVDDEDHTSIPSCFAVGDVGEGRPELTPVAIQAGVLLAKRLFGGSLLLTEYDKIATTVFTPLEYGCVGMAEEKAKEIYGEDGITVYHVTSQPLEFTLPQRDKLSCYSKLICLKDDEGGRICGFHYLGPNAGEITQGFALAIKLNATKEDLNGTVGIHPTSAEQLTTMNVTKESGENWVKSGC